METNFAPVSTKPNLQMEDLIAQAVKDLEPQASRVKEIEAAHQQLRVKTAEIQGQYVRAEEAVQAQQSVLMATCEIADFEKAVTLEMRAQAIRALFDRVGRSLAAPDHTERLWKQAFGNEMRTLAADFVPAVRERLQSLLTRSEADDISKAQSVDLEASDSHLTRQIRSHLGTIGDKPSWWAASNAARLLFT